MIYNFLDCSRRRVDSHSKNPATLEGLLWEGALQEYQPGRGSCLRRCCTMWHPLWKAYQRYGHRRQPTDTWHRDDWRRLHQAHPSKHYYPHQEESDASVITIITTQRKSELTLFQFLDSDRQPADCEDPGLRG